jgi:glucose-1-phosphate cytidylyltransferase
MKCVIFAGGMGTRLSEETQIKPKPMVEIGGKPILWHIMKMYGSHGVNEFIVCLGYKGYMIKEYFSNYCLHCSDVTFDMRSGEMEVHSRTSEPWRVTLIDTGEKTMTGGRLKAVGPWLGDDDFCLTYGDGLSDVDISETIEFHKRVGKLATVTAVQPPGRFGGLKLQSNIVTEFQEKPAGDGGWINGGFFVLSPQVVDFIDDETTVWEEQPLKRIAAEGQLAAYQHRGFWQAMDTLREKDLLQNLWNQGKAPWKTWSDTQLKVFGSPNLDKRRAA